MPRGPISEKETRRAVRNLIRVYRKDKVSMIISPFFLIHSGMSDKPPPQTEGEEGDEAGGDRRVLKIARGQEGQFEVTQTGFSDTMDSSRSSITVRDELLLLYRSSPPVAKFLHEY